MIVDFFKRGIAACVVVIAVCTFTANPTSGQRECCEGEIWLKWNRSQRKGFVDGYAFGFTEGYAGGCREGTRGWPGKIAPGYENDPLFKCSQLAPDFSKGTDFLEKSVTDFYLRYPQDRAIYITEVLYHVGKGLTLEEIHNFPFPRHERRPLPQGGGSSQ